MARFQRLRNLYEVVTNPKRYRNPDDRQVDLEETANPGTWRDETRATWRELLASRKRQVALFGYIGAILLGLLAVYSARFAPDLTGNPLLQEALKWAVALPITFWFGTRAIRSKLEHVDWLVLLKVRAGDQTDSGAAATGASHGGLGFFVGNRTEDADGNVVFEPLKGFSIMGLRGHTLTLGDLDDDFARQWSKQGRDASDPARIRVEDALYSDRDTFIGDITAVLTAGLELDEYGGNSDLYTQAPPLVDPERYRDMSDTISDLYREINKLEIELDSVKEERDDWREQAMQDRQEIKQEIVDTHGDLAEAGFGPRARGRTGRQPIPGEVYMNGGGED